MSGPALPERRRDRRRIRTALLVSLGAHAALLLVPTAWWQAVLTPGGGDAGGGGAPRYLAVSLFEWPADAPAEASEDARRDPEGLLPSRPETAPAPTPETPPAREPETPVETGESERLAETATDEPAEASDAPAAQAGPGPGSAGGPGENDAGSGAEGEGAVGPGGPGEDRFRPPRLLAGALPLTPEESEELPSPLEIEVRLRVGVDGRVIEVIPADPGLAPALREAVARSAEAMRFSPARRDGRAVPSWFTMTFIYRR